MDYGIVDVVHPLDSSLGVPFAVDGRETTPAGQVTVEEAAPVGFAAPFTAGPAVLYLQRA
jgi:hypothetical protein